MNELLNKETVKRVERSLREYNANLKVIALKKTARTAKDASISLKCELGAIVKSLVFKAEGEFLVCLVSGDKRCSLNKLKKILNKKDVAMANANEVKENTGFSIGGVAPIGYLKKLNIIVDKSLSRFKFVYGAAGHPDCVFKTTYSDLVQLANGKEEEIIE
ncbi:MAG: YbaK/EbsC family protein [Pelagibacteraceae bacterium TMED247]|nr:prolyl-tRNA editing protein [Candidatus Pelagibacter sp.]RPG05832.1 MAG: YbaK/EbsC family protein [Pelagibacteraceae bacterium TMED247]|tara:strand:+ start:1106 stop:1588 length:483 start_codon:yes stop_codon:yes gene_type:complete